MGDGGRDIFNIFNIFCSSSDLKRLNNNKERLCSLVQNLLEVPKSKRRKLYSEGNKLHVINTLSQITRTVKPRMKGFESTFDKIRATFVK